MLEIVKKKVHDGHVDELYEKVKYLKVTVMLLRLYLLKARQPESPSLKSLLLSRGSPPRGSHPRRSLDLTERDFNSITANKVQAALARGIQQRQALEQRDVLLTQYEASFGRRDVYEAMFQPRDEYGGMRAR